MGPSELDDAAVSTPGWPFRTYPPGGLRRPDATLGLVAWASRDLTPIAD
jgi:hypothetical protein